MSNNQETKIPLPTELSPRPSVIASDENPLSQYFRHTKISVELPSQGKFWPDGTLELPESGEVDILPLTAKDEIILKSPEGLLSGSSVVEAIASCVPAIKNPWAMPAIDVDAVFIGIRIASFNHELEVTSKCTHCGHTNDNKLDLRSLLDSIPRGDIYNIKTIGELTFAFTPYTFEFVNKQNKMKYEQERFARGISKSASADEVMQSEYLKNVFKELAFHNTDSIVTAITKISTATGSVVTDKNQITEFINNADRETIKQIRQGIDAMNASAEIKPIKIKCEECEKEFETSVEFNQSNFFE